MNHFMSIILICTALTVSACAQTDQPENSGDAIYQKMIPGSAELTTAKLKPGMVRYVKRGGQMSIELSNTLFKERNVLETKVWFNKPAGAPDPDTIRVDPHSFAFVSRRLALEDYLIEVEFTDDNRFVGSLTPTEESDFEPRVYDKAYPHSGFEPSILFFWIPSLPLEVGYRASIPTFDLNDGSQMIWANIEVVGREAVVIDGKSFDTLKVVSHGIRKKTLWIAKDFPYPVKMITKGSIGAWELEL